MSDELIDVLNEDLSFKMTALKSVAHKNGWFHASVHIWLYTQNSELLIQKRAANKIAFPNLWDVSVAGHISAGENKTTSALREIEEEIGLVYEERAMEYIGTIKEIHQHSPQFIDYELHHIYIGVLHCPISELTIQKEELSEIRLIDLVQFEQEIKEPNKQKDYVPHSTSYYRFVIDEIKKRL